MGKLFKDQRFLLIVLDIIISIAAYLAGRYFAPDDQELITLLIVSFQVIVAYMIKSLTEVEKAVIGALVQLEEGERIKAKYLR